MTNGMNAGSKVSHSGRETSRDEAEETERETIGIYRAREIGCRSDENGKRRR